MPGLSVVVPCFNEVEGVAALRRDLGPVLEELGRVHATGVEVVFVDDGSTDGTAEALEAAFVDHRRAGQAVVVVRHPRNLGLGAALRTGFQVSCGEVIVTTDSDGTYRFSEIPRLVDALAPGIDVVTASPYHPDGLVAGVPAWRLVLSRGASALYRVLLGGGVHTYTALFRAYRREVVREVGFASDGFLAGTEVLVHALLSGYRVVEVPAALHVRTVGASKARVARTTLAHVDFQRRVLLHRLGLRRLAGSR